MSLIFSISLHKSAQKSRSSAQNLQNLEEEIAKVEQEISLLEKEVEAAEQPFAQEKIIRDELLMKKPGEYVVQIPEKMILDQTPETQTETTTPWQEWQKILF